MAGEQKDIRSILPPEKGYELAPLGGNFGMILPEAGENLILYGGQASFYASFGVAGVVGTTVFTVDTNEARTESSLRLGSGTPHVIDNQGVYLPKALVADEIYTFSASVRLPLGRRLVIFADSPTGVRDKKVIIGTGFWQSDDVCLTFKARSSGVYHLGFFLDGTINSEFVWWIADFQLEKKDHRTTYIWGFSLHYYPGNVSNGWTGATYTSTSFRLPFSRSGGRLFLFKDVGFRVMSYRGLGMPPNRHIYNPYALLHGAYHQRRRFERRSFTIIGQFTTSSVEELHAQRHELSRLLTDHDLYNQEPLIMRFQLKNLAGQPIGRELAVNCRYVKGLEGDISSDFGEMVALEFVSDEWFIREEGGFGDEIYSPGSNLISVPFTFTVQSKSDIPAFGWAAIGADGGRITRIRNKTNGQQIDLDYTFVPGDYIYLSSDYVYGILRVAVYNSITDILVDKIAVVAPGGSLPMWYAAPITPTFNGENEFEFTWDPTISVVNATMRCYFMRAFSSIDAATSNFDMGV